MKWVIIINLINQWINIKSISTLLKNNGFSLKNHYTLNPSLDIDYVLKLKSKENKSYARQENCLFSLLSNNKFRADFERILKKHKKAGNILVIAQNMLDYRKIKCEIIKDG